MTYYYTTDAQDLSIERDARIYSAGSLTEVREALTLDVDLDDPTDDLVLAYGQFGDCWVKTPDRPTTVDVTPFAGDQVVVSDPGSNPGGREYWVTPVAPVIVAVPRSLAAEWQLTVIES